MGKEFFNGWALWQKMTFVLACAIVVTIGIGFVKLWYDQYRIRKYKAVAAAKKERTPEMVEAQAGEQEEVVPFGIRAIESGIEIDGVWISRSNTPAPSSPASSASSWVEPSSSQSRIGMPQPTHAGSSRASSRVPSAVLDQVGPGDQLSSRNGAPSPPVTRTSSPGVVGTRPTHPPSAYSRYSHSALFRSSGASDQYEGLNSAAPEPGRVSDESSPKESPGSSRTSSNSSQRSSRLGESLNHVPEGTEPRAAPPPPPEKDLPKPLVDRRVDLDLLQSHRLSHVAETGQLTPRVRRPNQSGDWAAVADGNKQEAVEYFIPRRTTPSPPNEAGTTTPRNPFASPSSSANNSRPTTSDAATQTNMDAGTQTLPYFDVYQPAGPDFSTEVPTNGARRPVFETEPSAQPPPALNKEPKPDGEQPKAGETFQHDRDDQVLRRVNAGFEILRPGTFSLPADFDIKELEAGAKRQSRKLQKKRRPSSSTASHVIEAV